MISSSESLRGRAPERILVRLPSWVGDTLMATPALRALRRAHPKAWIAALGRPALQGLLARNPDVDRFQPAPTGRLADALGQARQLRRQGYDWAVLLPDSPRTALAPYLARIPVRVGYARDPLRRALLTSALSPPRANGSRRAISMVERYLAIPRALGCPDAGRHLELPIDPAARQGIAQRLQRAGIERQEPLLVVTPGARFGPSKCWPPEHFARACDGLEAAWGLRTVLAPGPGEEPLADAIAERMQRRPLVLAEPVATLPELAALIDEAALLLGNDTGPRHLAVARGRPVITLMGPTDPAHTEHWMDRQRVLREPVPCSPCHRKVCPIDHRCMTRLAPERVLQAARELLS